MPKDESNKDDDKTVENKIDALTKAVNDNKMMQEALKDPQILELIAARQRGEKVTIVPVDAMPVKKEDEKETTMSNDDINYLDNTQMLDLVSKRIGGSLDEAIKKALAPFNDRLDVLDNRALSQDSTKINAEVKAVKEKYSDFEEFEQAMVKLNKQAPGMDVEELYLIARKRAGKGLPTPENTDSERPTDTLSAALDHRRATRKTDEKARPGHKGMLEMLREGSAKASEKIVI